MIEILPYDPLHEEGIQRLLSIPVSGDIQISFERQPNYYKGSFIQTAKPEIYTCLDEGKVVGVFNIGTRMHYINGAPKEVAYFCDFRIDPEYQDTSLFYRTTKFVFEKDRLFSPYPAITVVFSDNKKLIDIINRRKYRKNITVPVYHELFEIQSFLFRKVPKSFQNSKFEIRSARKEDIAELVEFQKQNQEIPYSPYFDFTDLESPHYQGMGIENFILAKENDKIVGMIQLFDTSFFKQTRIQGYSLFYRLIKPIFNTLGPNLFGFPSLPRNGDTLDAIAIQNIIVSERRNDIFESLLFQAVSSNLGKTFILCLDNDDPLYSSMKRIFGKIVKDGKVFLINKSTGPIIDYDSDYYLLDIGRI